ncbi:MAG: SDR family oxidoreductase [Planctomycetes bacterium]|nr:SDR family oxidoreductase [Planctomycetota bacterium]
MKLAGTNALITGAGRRIGRALALAFAAEGVGIAVHYRDSRGDAEELAEEIQASGGKAVAIGADLAMPGGAETVFVEASSSLGAIQLLVNNASRFEPAGLDATDRARWEEELALHATAPYILSREVARHLPADSEGRIINILDWRAELPDPRYLAYSAAKGALHALTLALARALAPRITVNGISPGAILPPAGGAGKGSGDYVRDLPLARVGSTDDIVRACLFFARDADYVTGAILPVDGGRHLL